VLPSPWEARPLRVVVENHHTTDLASTRSSCCRNLRAEVPATLFTIGRVTIGRFGAAA
jgi:hypothetical protein